MWNLVCNEMSSKILTVITTVYCKGAWLSMTTKTWNNIQSQIKDLIINAFSPKKIKLSLWLLFVSASYLSFYYFLWYICMRKNQYWMLFHVLFLLFFIFHWLRRVFGCLIINWVSENNVRISAVKSKTNTYTKY